MLTIGCRMTVLALAVVLGASLWVGPLPAQQTVELPGLGGQGPETELQEQALAAMEMLREEIVTLAALRDAQAALLSWNREGAKTGAPAQALPAGLCRDPALAAWCPLLPATFGAPWTEDGHDRD